jgi:outer membrane receptor for ferrienterochelin and colicins
VSLDGYDDMVVQTGLDVDYSTFKDNFNEGTEITGKTLDQTQIAVFGESEYFINENWIATLGARVHWSDIFNFHLAPTWCGSLLRPSALRAAWPTVIVRPKLVS